MSQQGIRLTGSGGVNLPAEAVDKLIQQADGRAALLYIYAQKYADSFTPQSAAEALKMTQGEISATLNALRDMGLVEGERPHVELRSPVTVDQDFKMLVGETQRKLGTALSSSELDTLSRIYHDLGFPCEVISILISHCLQRTRARLGENRTPTLRQIEKEAFIWADKGIMTLEAATEYLRKYEKARENSGAVKAALGLGSRSLTDAEQSYIEGWLGLGFGPEEIGEAYSRTVLNTGGLKWPYLNKIITTWDKKGLHTLQEIKTGDTKPAAGTAGTAGSKAPGDEDVAAVRRLYQARRGNKED